MYSTREHCGLALYKLINYNIIQFCKSDAVTVNLWCGYLYKPFMIHTLGRNIRILHKLPPFCRRYLTAKRCLIKRNTHDNILPYSLWGDKLIINFDITCLYLQFIITGAVTIASWKTAANSCVRTTSPWEHYALERFSYYRLFVRRRYFQMHFRE